MMQDAKGQVEHKAGRRKGREGGRKTESDVERGATMKEEICT